MNDTTIRLRRVLEVAATVPGNRKRFFEAGLIDAKNEDELRSPHWQSAFLKLRPIDKRTVREHPGLFLANVTDVVYRGTTSGSRGQHFIYFAGAEWNEVRIRARRQSLQWWGISDDTPIVNVASRLLPLRATDLAIAGQPNQVVRLLLAELTARPVAIRGYPSRLCEVAALLTRCGTPPVVAVICTGECLFEYQRSLLAEVFRAPVIEEYGCQETGISGLTCPEAGRLHLDAERCLYEVIDGELVTTDLLNHIMPLVRYKCGDSIQLNTEPCPCGRPEPTARILGRIEDWIRTADGMKRPGEISMPPLDGILNYSMVRREGTQLDIWLQPVAAEPPLEQLVTWTHATFGEVSAQVFCEDTQETNPLPERSCDDALWIRNITEGAWAEWLHAPLLPRGQAKLAAQLLKKLVEPVVMTYSGLPSATQALVYDLLDSPPCPDPQVERMCARVLLFSCNFLADPQVSSIYSQAAERLRRAVAQIGTQDDAAVVDLLVPTLFLSHNTATSIWAEGNWPVQCKLDTFNVHNLLQAFEPAMYRANAFSSQTVQRLKPILSLLIGDLNFFAPRFGTWLLAHWCDLIFGQPTAQGCVPEALKDDFLTAWLAWRLQMLSGGQNAQQLMALQAAAKSPEEQARVEIEKGYDLLIRGQALDPHEWLDLIKVKVGVLSRGLRKDEVDLTPWIPILRSLAKSLLAKGEQELAYQCLIASAPPSSRTLAFERLAFQVNDKQSVICDIALD